MAYSLLVKLPLHGACPLLPACLVWRQRTKVTTPTSRSFPKTAQDGQASRNKQTQRGEGCSPFWRSYVASWCCLCNSMQNNNKTPTSSIAINITLHFEKVLNNATINWQCAQIVRCFHYGPPRLLNQFFVEYSHHVRFWLDCLKHNYLQWPFTLCCLLIQSDWVHVHACHLMPVVLVLISSVVPMYCQQCSRNRSRLWPHRRLCRACREHLQLKRCNHTNMNNLQCYSCYSTSKLLVN